MSTDKMWGHVKIGMQLTFLRKKGKEKDLFWQSESLKQSAEERTTITVHLTL